MKTHSHLDFLLSLERSEAVLLLFYFWGIRMCYSSIYELLTDGACLSLPQRPRQKKLRRMKLEKARVLAIVTKPF